MFNILQVNHTDNIHTDIELHILKMYLKYIFLFSIESTHFYENVNQSLLTDKTRNTVKYSRCLNYFRKFVRRYCDCAAQRLCWLDAIRNHTEQSFYGALKLIVEMMWQKLQMEGTPKILTVVYIRSLVNHV